MATGSSTSRKFDPHFGSKEDLKRLIESSKMQGIGTILDIVVNHTADVIQPADGVYNYQDKFSKPYLDADGTVFDDREYIDKPSFPKLDAHRSFPAPPTFLNEADRGAKFPDWLDEPTIYHNRGGVTTGGESARVRRRRGLGRSLHRAGRSPARDDCDLFGLDQRASHCRISIGHRETC